MAKKKATIGAGVALDGEKEFRQAISNINSDMKVLTSELKKVTTEFTDNKDSIDALTSKHDVLNKQLDTQKDKVEAIKKALENSKEQYGENDKKTKDWQISLNNAEADLNKLTSEIKNNEKAMENALNPTDDVSESIKDIGDNSKDAGKDALSLGDIIKANLISEAIIGGVKALGSAILGFGGAILDTVEDTKEFRQDMSRLEQNTKDAGLSFDTMKDKLANVSAITGETDAAIEGLSNLMATGFNDSQMQEALDGLSGAIIKFPDTLKIEGLADSLQETIKTGEGSGQFVELLGRMGQDTEAFNEAMSNATTEAERQQIALDALAKTGLSEVNSQYQETNKAMISAEEAQFKLDDAIATFASNIEPLVATLKGGFAEVLTNLVGTINGDEEAFNNLGDSVNDLATDFLDIVENAIPLLEEVLSKLIPALAETIIENLPKLVESAVGIIETLVNTIVENLPEIIDSSIEILNTVVKAILDNLPMLLEAALEIIVSLADGLVECLPDLIPAVVDTVVKIVETLIENVDMLIDASIEIILALADGLIDSLPTLIEKAPTIVKKLVDALVDNAPKLLTSAAKLIGKLVSGIVDNLPEIGKAALDIIDTLKKGFTTQIHNMLTIGGDLVEGIWDGISDKTQWILDKIKGFGDSVLTGIKKFFGINSPSRLFRDEIGTNLALGLGEGFTNEMDDITSDMVDSIPTDFDIVGKYNLSGNTSLNDNLFNLNNSTPNLSVSFTGDVIINNDIDVETLGNKLGVIAQQKMLGMGGGRIAYSMV